MLIFRNFKAFLRCWGFMLEPKDARYIVLRWHHWRGSVVPHLLTGYTPPHRTHNCPSMAARFGSFLLAYRALQWYRKYYKLKPHRDWGPLQIWSVGSLRRADRENEALDLLQLLYVCHKTCYDLALDTPSSISVSPGD